MGNLRIITIIWVVGIPLLCTGVPQANEGYDFGDPRMVELLDTCIDAQNHKTKPGPDDSLHRQCSPWGNRSCCTSETSVNLHYQKSYNFDWHHCSARGRLSDNCTRHFTQDLCFYECSPNVGPWKVKVNMKIRKERFYKVPLCASDCEAWFNDCENDFTCTDNWAMNFEWVKGMGNRCPTGSTCRTFREIYRDAKYFCETVWDHSWEVVPDNEHCMRLWFDPSGGNPNDDVAVWKAKEIIQKINRGGVSDGIALQRAKNAATLYSSLLLAVFVQLVH